MTVWFCLRNVDTCDMFLGFYGARYGTVYNPQDSRTDWVKQDFDFARKDFPWVDQFRTKAVTELEFRYGWLNDNMPNGIGNARGLRPSAFFFRNPAYDKRMEKEDKENAYAYRNPYPSDVEKLSMLKTACEECAPTTYYDSPTKVAELFKETCDGWMTQMLPEAENMTKFGQENGAHFAFQSARTAMYLNCNMSYAVIVNRLQYQSCAVCSCGRDNFSLALFHVFIGRQEIVGLKCLCAHMCVRGNGGPC